MATVVTPGNGGQKRLAVLEVDEGSLLSLSRLVTKVDMIMVTNLFPDQLDRYGSVTALAQQMKKAFAAWPKATLLLNADDPLVASFGHDRTHTCYFAVETADDNNTSGDSKLKEISLCPFCGQTLNYTSRRYDHLGSYTGPGCGFNRPQSLVTTWPLQNKKKRRVPDFMAHFGRRS